MLAERTYFSLAAGAAMAFLVPSLALSPASARESKTYVVNWFTDASYYAGEGAKSECPDGLNISSIDFYRRDLLRIGHSKEKVEEVLKDFPGEGGLTQPWVPLVMTRGNGKDNVYANPTTAPDPQIKTVKGKYAYGFNLDGRNDADDFVEADTGEIGVDNQMYRAMGCIRSYRALPPPGRPNQPETHWDILRNVMTAWIVTISSEDRLDRDGPVTVAFNRALQKVTRDSSGLSVQAHMTFRLDPDPRTQSVMQGTLKEGVINASPGNFRVMLDEYIASELSFDKARLRLEMKPDGKLVGLVGGYQPWYPIYYGVARVSHIAEYAASVDAPGLYYALRKMADADPDPKTGKNRSISMAWQLEALPAFAIGPDGQTASATAVSPAATAR